MDLSSSTVAITYKDDGNQDGICSQLLRIYGTYAISRLLGVPYFHSSIAHLGYHGLAALENNAPLPELLTDVNRIFHIPSDIELADKQVMIHDMVDADIESIERIQNNGCDGRLDLIRILYPFPVTDRHPELYRYLKRICPFPYRRSQVFRLAIHVRRGEIYAIANDWLLPNSYYVSCVLRFQETLRKLDIPFVCELYTEVPSKPFEVTPEHHGIFGRIPENMIFDPAMNQLEDFDAIPNLERFINLDPIESLRRMTTADALIISHSSFSYFPAVLNPDSIVVYHPYWRSRMKNWLVSNDEGVFPESELVERLKLWKRAAGVDSTAAISRPQPRNLHGEIVQLLKPFQGQSATIRSIVAVGWHRILGMAEEAVPVRLVLDEGSVRPSIRVEPMGTAKYTLESLAQEARERSEPTPGEDLILLPAQVLDETTMLPIEELKLGAVAVVYIGALAEDNWKHRLRLFDRGLICIGCVDFSGGRAFCFLRSDAIRCFNQLDIASRGHVTMVNLLEGAGFANQLWRYACIKLYALRHGLTPAVPAWQGNQLFGLEDKSCDGLDFRQIDYPGFAKNDRELWDREDPPVDIDLRGFFQEIPECWRQHRELLRHMFKLSPEHVQAIDAWRDAVTDGGRRTLVAVSVRRGDYHKFQNETAPWFRIVPEEWYLDWLRAIWPTLHDPVLFVTSDEPDKLTPLFAEFENVSATFVRYLPRHVRDFEVLRSADYLAICNSSYPRLAAVLAPSSQKCFLPSFHTQSFEAYEPWMDPAFWERFEDAWGSTKQKQRPDATVPQLPANQYVPLTSDEPRAELMFMSGWLPADVSGIRACRPKTTLRFRADAPVGARINLVLRLSACGRDFRIRMRSGCGTENEVDLAQGSTRPAVLAATVEPGNLVTAHLLTIGAEDVPDGAYWMLQGILYFDPKRASG